jgi:hypothetical protein
VVVAVTVAVHSQRAKVGAQSLDPSASGNAGALPWTGLAQSPNKSLQRSVNHKVLGRGRDVPALCRAPRARVLKRTRAAAELSR